MKIYTVAASQFEFYDYEDLWRPIDTRLHLCGRDCHCWAREGAKRSQTERKSSERVVQRESSAAA